MAAVEAALQTESSAAAMEHDGVVPASLVILVEAEPGWLSRPG
jgi:hypothetical protein